MKWQFCLVLPGTVWSSSYYCELENQENQGPFFVESLCFWREKAVFHVQTSGDEVVGF